MSSYDEHVLPAQTLVLPGNQLGPGTHVAAGRVIRSDLPLARHEYACTPWMDGRGATNAAFWLWRRTTCGKSISSPAVCEEQLPLRQAREAIVGAKGSTETAGW